MTIFVVRFAYVNNLTLFRDPYQQQKLNLLVSIRLLVWLFYRKVQAKTTLLGEVGSKKKKQKKTRISIQFFSAFTCPPCKATEKRQKDIVAFAELQLIFQCERFCMKHNGEQLCSWEEGWHF